MKIGLYLSAIVVFSLSAYDISAQQLNDSVRTQLELGTKGFRERYHSPSIVVVIVHGDEIIFSDAGGFTDLQNKIPATMDSRYQIQSITKMFTATMFMQLWERGIINGNDPIAGYVPEYHGDATFLELVTHNSGLPRNSPADIGFVRQVDRWLLTKKNQGPIRSATEHDFIKSLRFIDRQYPDYEFLGAHTRHYSNLGYGLLGLALKRAAKRGYEEYVLSEICAPLKLTNTGFGTVSTEENSIAKGYFYRGDSAEFIRTPDYYPESVVPAAGMYSTARDLAKFISAQFSGNNPTLLGKSRRMMQQLGIGWLRNYPFIMHEGSMLGARSEIVLHPELRIGWAVLANTTDFPFDRINDYIANLIIPLYTPKPITEPVRCIGTYTLEGELDSLEIYLKDGELYSTYLNDLMPAEPLTFSGNNSLIAKGRDGYDIRYNFIAGSGSEIKALSLNQLLWIKQ
jgi:Beta-lactamase class C and other penicillin binding proteins